MPTRILVVDDSPTIRKVVTGILARHGYDHVAAADGQFALDALGEDEKFDLVLLDFVMPRMNGYQFCRAVRSQERLRSLPVVLMSAKSDKIREQFVQQTGAIDAISKPFDAQALVTVIENALKRVELGNARAAATSMSFEGDEPPSSLRQITEDSVRMARTAIEVGTRIAKFLAPALAALPAGAIGDSAQIATALSAKLSPDLLREVGISLRDLDFGERGPVVLSGDLASLPIGAVLQMLQVERQTGILEITRYVSAPAPGSQITITWRNGLVDLVQSRRAGDEFRLGRFFVEEGLVTPEEIDVLLKNAESQPPPPPGGAPPPSSGRLLGDLLVDAGRVSEQQLRAALVRQASELIYELLRWHRGRFEFRKQGASPLAERAKLSLPIASIVMEGFRRVDEWRVVEAGLGSFDAVLQRDPMSIEAAGVDKLPRAERAILDAIDGERTVREIIAASNMSSFDACRILCQLMEARLVRPRAA